MPKRLTVQQRGPLGSRLYERRRALGLEQSDLASRIGISVSGYRHWETGKVEKPNPHHLAGAAEALGVSSVWLETGSESVDEDTIQNLRSEIEQMRMEFEQYLGQDVRTRQRQFSLNRPRRVLMK